MVEVQHQVGKVSSSR